jgi:hypothetical protein
MRIAQQAVHPSELIGVFVRARRVAIGQIKRGDAHGAASGADLRLDETGMIVLGVARQPRRHLIEGDFGQDRDPVEGLLPMNRDVVAQRLDRLPREAIVDAFGFLQADDIRRPLLQPGEQAVHPLLDRVDVPRGDAHGQDDPGGFICGATCPVASSGERSGGAASVKIP